MSRIQILTAVMLIVVTSTSLASERTISSTNIETPTFSSLFGAADSLPAPGVGKRPIVGLTLSGGSAKGLAHIGVLKVLEREGIDVDLVTGNSMGSLMGALYALGYTPAMLEEIAVTTDWIELLSNKLDRRHVSIEDKEKMERYAFDLVIDGLNIRPGSGLLSGMKVHRLLTRLTWPANFYDDFGDLPKPFRCLATDITTGEGVILDKGSLADAMRASMAIPGVFAPIEIDGRMLVDGMLVRNFPTEDAIDMGAEIVIGSDVGSDPLDLDKIHSLLDIINQSVVLGDLENRQGQIALCDLLFLPDLKGIGSFSFSKAAEIIRRGEECAMQQIDEIRALSEYLSAWENHPVRGEIDLERPMPICDFRIDCDDEIDMEAVRSFIGIAPPCEVTAKQLESIVDHLYGMRSYSQVRYRFEKKPDCNTLVFVLDRDSRDYVYTGLRYDSTWRTSLLFNLSINEFLNSHSDLEIDILLGRRMIFGGSYDFKAGTKNRIGIRGDSQYLSDRLDVYTGDHLEGRMDVRYYRAGLFAEYSFSRFLFWDVGFVTEWAQTTPDIAPRDYESDWTRMNLLVTDVWFDNLDREWFPTSGVQLRVRGEYGDFEDVNTDLFNRVAGRLVIRIPLHERVSGGIRCMFGSSDGEDIPAHYRFYVGGMNSPFMFQDRREINFYGYRHQELSGEHAFIAGMDLQLKASSMLYCSIHGNWANATSQWDDLFDRDKIVYGGGMTFGVAAPLGPVELTMMASRRHPFRAFFSAGYRF